MARSVYVTRQEVVEAERVETQDGLKGVGKRVNVGSALQLAFPGDWLVYRNGLVDQVLTSAQFADKYEPLSAPASEGDKSPLNVEGAE